MEKTYHQIFSRLGLQYRAVEADPGAIGGSGSREFMVLAENGEDTILYCNSCSYAANAEEATSRLKQYKQDQKTLPKQDIFGEGLIGVEPLAKFLNIPVWKTTKTLLYNADDKVVAVMVRGDCAVNEVKVRNYLGCQRLSLASAPTVRTITGAEVGYAGPLNLPSEVLILADQYVLGRVNFECGANRTNYHTINVNFGQDLGEPQTADLKLAEAGHACPRCSSGQLLAAKGIEVGHIFKLGTKYSKEMQAFYLDSNGKSQPIYMGCYGIGVSRIAAACIEQSHDDKGIIWPKAIAPFSLHLVALNLEDSQVAAAAEALYQQLLAANLSVLYDDRNLRAGDKFSDADLIGIPWRITLSKRTLANKQVEIKARDGTQTKLVELDKCLDFPGVPRHNLRL